MLFSTLKQQPKGAWKMTKKDKKPTKILVRELELLAKVFKEREQISRFLSPNLCELLDLKFQCLVLSIFIKHNINYLIEGQDFDFFHHSEGANDLDVFHMLVVKTAHLRLGGPDGLGSRFRCKPEKLVAIDRIFDLICSIFESSLNNNYSFKKINLEQCFVKNDDGTESFSLVMAHALYDERLFCLHLGIKEECRRLYDSGPLYPRAMDLMNIITAIIEDNKH